MLAPALRRNAANCAFNNLQKRLLDTLARNVARNRNVVGLRGDFIDFVDVDDTALGELDIAVGVLEQIAYEILNVFTDVAGLSENCRVADGERNAEDLGESFRHQRFARTGRTEKKNVGLLDLDVVGCGGLLALALGALRLGGLKTAVVVMNRDRKNLLRLVVADHMLVEKSLDLFRGRRGRQRRRGLLR